MAEDPADTGGRGGPGGKKESASGKAAPDGKLVKGTRPGLPGVPDVCTCRVGLSQGPRWLSRLLCRVGPEQNIASD